MMSRDQAQREIHLLVRPGVDPVEVRVSFSSDEANDIHYLMPAAEYLLYLTATKSSLGFEGALELLCQGAMTWRTKNAATDST